MNNVFSGKYYRITVLTERLVRLEYSIEGIFEDRTTEFAINRNMYTTEFEANETEKLLTIKTKYFNLTYKKNQSFKGNKINPASNLRVEMLGADKTWYYNHPEIRNYGGIKPSLNSPIATTKGLYSIDGFSSFDDSTSRILLDNGMYGTREHTKEYIDVYLFMYNNDYNLALKDYFSLTGYPILVPKYALGIWWSRDYKYTQREIIELVEKFKEKKIPLSVLLLDKYWHEHRTTDDIIENNRYLFNDLYIDSEIELLNYLNRNNIKLGLNIEPSTGIKIKNEFGEEITEPYNVMEIKFIKALLSNILIPYKRLGINIIWLDYKKNINDITILSKYLGNINDIRENRPIILSRATTIAPHRNGIVYTGRTKVSYETLKKLPYFTSRSANIGVSWISNDIGGYYGGVEDDELYIRSVQLGVFSPIFRFHGGTSRFYKKEPWNRSISTYHIVRDYMDLRQRLIPYIYTEGYNYAVNAIPLIRPLYYTNKDIYDEPQYLSEYYFGSQMLIAPITQKRDYMIKRVIHKFFLPKGIWYDFKTGKKYIGNNDHIGLYKKEEYPIFVKAGGIIPMFDKENNQENLNIMIFQGVSNSYELYEDDGTTMLYKQGNYELTKINYEFNESQINLSIKATRNTQGIIPLYRNIKVIFRNTAVPAEIICKQNNSDINFEYEIINNDLIVSVNNTSTSHELKITLLGNNLEKSSIKKLEEDLEKTISDMPIETPLKEKIGNIIFSDRGVKEKRIEIIRLKNLIPKNYYPLILKLLDYTYEI